MEEKKENVNNNNEEVESQLITIQKYISLLIIEFKDIFKNIIIYFRKYHIILIYILINLMN